MEKTGQIDRLQNKMEKTGQKDGLQSKMEKTGQKDGLQNKMERTGQIDRLLKKVEKPGRYVGEELNMVRKNPEDMKLRFGFAFPDTYEIGMSYMGMQILYNIINKQKDVYCERIFAPAKDMEALMREEKFPLFTVETKTPVKEMDVLGFTLQYELSYTNILNILELSGIPLTRQGRSAAFNREAEGENNKQTCIGQEGEDITEASSRNDGASGYSLVETIETASLNNTAFSYPLLVAGGPCAYNPEPLADIFDIFMIGDGEENNVELCDLCIKAKEGSWSREKLLQEACKIDGVYVPEFYEPVYNDDGTIKKYEKLYSGAPDVVERALVEDIENAEYPEKPLVPLVEIVHDRAVVETFRGCSRGCRFCQAGMIYRPVREKKPETVKKLAEEQLKNTGHEELSLLSLSTSDYSQFEPLAIDLMQKCKKMDVSLSLPSLRLDSFSFNVLQEIQGYRKSGLTFAPEAGTQRLRDVINKGVTEEDIYSAMRQAIELGWNGIKLYFMAGLPTETDEDLDGIANIAKRIKDMAFEINGKAGGKFRVTVSVSNFVPKPFTPFQWVPQASREEFIRKHDYLSERLKNIRGVVFNYHESNVSFLEAVFARGDRRVGKVLKRAFELGCKFDAWTEDFRIDLWEQAFKETGIDPEFYTGRERQYDEVLPWDIIDAFISKEFLISENENGKKEKTTPDCRLGCNNCGMSRKADCLPRR